MKTTDKECEVKKINMKNTRWKICLICERLTLEKWFYFSVWVGSIMYGIYYFAKSSNDFFRNYVDYYDDFEEGTFLNRKRDQSDGEFEEISSIFKQFGTLMFASLIIFEIQRKFTNNKEFLKLTQIFISFYGLIHNFGFKYFFVLLSQPLIYTAIVYNFKNKAPLYILVVFNIIWSKWMFTMFIIHKVFDELSIIVAFVGYGWSILKCSCFYFESNVVTKSTFIDLLEFVFYLPTFFYGPILMYTDYEEKYNFEKYKPLRERALSLLKNGLRILFWYVFTYILLHYLYISAMRVEALYDFDSTSLYAYGFLMGTYFQLKYLILYGIGTMFASFYNIPVPALPRCIGRIHLYSDMWKYFDVGLYHYLVKYIYKPSLFSKSFLNKIFSGALTFIFIWCWHGMTHQIFLWSMYNFLVIIIENVGIALYQTEFVKGLEQTFGQFYFQKLKHFCIGCLMILNSISNFHFLGSTEVANVFFERIYRDPIQKTAILIFLLFSLSEFSDTIRDVPAAVM